MSSEESPDLPGFSSTFVESEDSDEDPTVSYAYEDQYSLWDIWRKAPWFRSWNKWIVLFRSFQILCCVGLFSSFTAAAVFEYIGDHEKEFILSMQILTLAIYLMYWTIMFHTVLVSRYGIDKYYVCSMFPAVLHNLLHIVVFNISPHKVPIWTRDWESLTKESALCIRWVIGTVFYVFWFIPQRMLYTSTFRAAVKFFYMDEQYLLKQLVAPLVVIFALEVPLRIIFCFTDIGMILNQCSSITCFLYCIYEMFSYVILDPGKNKLTHLFNFCAMETYEIVYVSIALLSLVVSTFQLVWVFTNIGEHGTHGDWKFWFWQAIDFLSCFHVRWVFLWWYAVEKLNMQALVYKHDKYKDKKKEKRREKFTWQKSSVEC